LIIVGVFFFEKWGIIEFHIIVVVG